MRFFAALRMTGGVGVQNDRVFTLMKMRANTVSVASEWYSAKRNKPSRSCEANGRPCGIYKIAAGGETPLCLGRLPLRRPFAHSRHLRCRTWRIGNGRRNPALPWPPSITAAIRTQSPPAVSDTAKRQREAERLPYGLDISTKQSIVILNAVKDLWCCKHGRIIALQIIAEQRFFSHAAPSE